MQLQSDYTNILQSKWGNDGNIWGPATKRMAEIRSSIDARKHDGQYREICLPMVVFLRVRAKLNRAARTGGDKVTKSLLNALDWESLLQAHSAFEKKITNKGGFTQRPYQWRNVVGLALEKKQGRQEMATTVANHMLMLLTREVVRRLHPGALRGLFSNATRLGCRFQNWHLHK